MQEQPKHTAAYEFYRDMPKRSYQGVATKFTVSMTSVKKWSKAFKWKMRIAAWDAAIREGVEEGALEALVDTRIKSIEQLDRTMDEIDAVMPMIFDALQSCTIMDTETGKRRVKIIPETTQDMTALYAAQTRFATAKVKLVETMRKVMGESDNVKVSGEVKHEMNITDTMREYDGLLAKITPRNQDTNDNADDPE